MKSIIQIALKLIPRPLLISLSYPFKAIAPIFLRGNNFHDPIDGNNYRIFLPYGYEKKRKNALAPGTLSLERHRLLWLYLKNQTDFFTKKLTVLHIAPEQCFYTRFKKLTNLHYTTSDLNSPLADVKADICNLPFSDNLFDVILCNHVLEHITDDLKAIEELYRVMKPNGWGIFQIPMNYNLEKTYEDFNITKPEERIKHFGQYDHVRVYGWDYFERLKSVGFHVEKISITDKLTPKNIKKFGLEKDEILPLVRKL